MSNYDRFLFVDRETKFRGFQKLLQPETRQTVMVIEAPPDMGKTWLIGKMKEHCQRPESDVPVARIDFRNPRLIHELQDQVGLVRALRDGLGQSHLFNNLNAVIVSFTEVGVRASGGLALLRQNIERYFSLAELKTLVTDMGINYDNLAGETLQAKSRELVNYCQRQNMIRFLVELCAQLRTQIDWQKGLDLEPVETQEGSGSQPAGTPITDTRAPIWADSDMERRRAERQINQAFFECLDALLVSKGRVALLFDSYEAAPPEAERWLIEELLPHLRENKAGRIVVIITGRKTPDLTDLQMKPLLVQTSLEPFTEQDVREYFEDRRQVSGLDLRTVVLTSGGIPGALAMMADHAVATSEEDDDFFSDL